MRTPSDITATHDHAHNEQSMPYPTGTLPKNSHVDRVGYICVTYFCCGSNNRNTLRKFFGLILAVPTRYSRRRQYDARSHGRIRQQPEYPVERSQCVWRGSPVENARATVRLPVTPHSLGRHRRTTTKERAIKAMQQARSRQRSDGQQKDFGRSNSVCDNARDP